MSMTEQLAKEILDFDEDHPGPPDAEVVIDSETWKRWVDIAAGEVSFTLPPEACA